jgi:hypothetical protein
MRVSSRRGVGANGMLFQNSRGRLKPKRGAREEDSSLGTVWEDPMGQTTKSEGGSANQ